MSVRIANRVFGVGQEVETSFYRDPHHIYPYLVSQTLARLAKDNPAHNGSKGGKRRSHFPSVGPGPRTHVHGRDAGRIPSAGELAPHRLEIGPLSSTPYRFPPTVLLGLIPPRSVRFRSTKEAEIGATVIRSSRVLELCIKGVGVGCFKYSQVTQKDGEAAISGKR